MRELLKEGSDKLGIPLSGEQLSSFILFSEELKKWGLRINLTALLKDEERLAEELFLDSLAPLKVIGKRFMEGDSLLDIGSGAGVPGIPIKIAEPALTVTLTDSTEKKIFFMRHVIRALSLTGIEAKRVTFFDFGAPGLAEGAFDWAVAKAVADIETLGRWALPHLKKYGGLVCMKGLKERCVPLEGYSEALEHSYSLPFTGVERKLFVYKKL